jgi:hypothetical protein
MKCLARDVRLSRMEPDNALVRLATDATGDTARD